MLSKLIVSSYGTLLEIAIWTPLGPFFIDVASILALWSIVSLIL